MSMLSRMPAVLAKLGELALAGVASAAGAYLFGQFTKPDTPPPAPPAQIVQIEPTQEELVRAVRNERAALIEELRKAETAKETAKETAPEPLPPRTASVAAPKPPKASPAGGASHKPPADRGGMAADRKSEHVYEADSKVPTEERAPAPVGPPLVLSGSGPAAPVVDSTAAIEPSPATEPRFRWFARLRRIPDIFRPAPSAPSLAPRPPLPVGEFVQGAM